MKLMIDSSGSLLIERAGRMIEQFCPFAVSGRHCGDECPLFREPVRVATADEGRTQIWGIVICQDRGITGELTDERGKP